LYRRIHFPSGVIRGSSSGVEEAPILSAPTTIDRNFSMTNGAPPRPTRSPLCSDGPGDVSLTAAAANRMMGPAHTMPATAATMSTPRLTTLRSPIAHLSGFTWVRPYEPQHPGVPFNHRQRQQQRVDCFEASKQS